MILALLMAIAAAAPATIVERRLTPSAVGPNRFDPDPSMLATAAPLRYNVSGTGNNRIFSFTGGLDDLRLRDASGAEHPYLLVAPPTKRPQWSDAAMRPVMSTKTASGFDADLGSPVEIDRIRIEGVAAPFLKRVRLEGSGDSMHWTLLRPEATIFDLPEQQLRDVEVPFEHGSFRFLRVMWDDRSSARVTHVGSVAARHYDSAANPGSTRIPLNVRTIASETGKSRYRLALPGSHLPIASIELRVTNGNVFRDAAINEGRLSGSTVEPAPLGASKLRRAERDNAVAEQLTIPITFPEGRDLDLVVEDANNPPLEIKAINAVLTPLPWIYFESEDGKPLTATYGDRTLKPPAYDLEARRDAANAAQPPRASLSPAQVAARREAADEVPIAGGPVERKKFQFARSIGPTEPGLTSLVLDADVLSRSAALNDVRIASADDHQIPYLVERRDAPLMLALRIPQRMRGEGTHSIYRFVLPYDSLPSGTRLAIATSAHVFERTATLSRVEDERRGRDREVIASETWRGVAPDATPGLTFDASLAGSREVELDLDEGDNAPLPITSAQLLLPSYALRFISPGGSLTLLYGNPGATAPRYDLAILAPRLFSESAHDISLTRAAPMVSTPEAGTERKIFWAVIGIAVIALLITLARLLSSGVTTSES